MRHPVPTDAGRLAFAITTEAGRIQLAQRTDTVTGEALIHALSAAQRLRRLAASMETSLRRQIATARQVERDTERERQGAERRNDAIRAERGLPTGSADLVMPVMP